MYGKIEVPDQFSFNRSGACFKGSKQRLLTNRTKKKKKKDKSSAEVQFFFFFSAQS